MKQHRPTDAAKGTDTFGSLGYQEALGRKTFFFSLLASILTICLARIGRTHLKNGRPQTAVFAFDHIGHEININGAYESYELDIMVQWLSRHGFIRGSLVDIGANIGNHSLFFSRHYKKVFSFEPNKKVFELLTLNARLVDNIRCYNVGLSDSSNTAALLQSKSNIGGSRIVSCSASDATVPVELRVLDEIADIQDQAIGLIKVDIEGHEYQALTGARNTIKKNRPIILFEQKAADFDGGTSATVELLKSLGYTRFAVVRSYPRLSRKLPAILRILTTIAVRAALGFGFEVQEVRRFSAVDYSMVIAIPQDAAPSN